MDDSHRFSLKNMFGLTQSTSFQKPKELMIDAKKNMVDILSPLKHRPPSPHSLSNAVATANSKPASEILTSSSGGPFVIQAVKRLANRNTVLCYWWTTGGWIYFFDLTNNREIWVPFFHPWPGRSTTSGQTPDSL